MEPLQLFCRDSVISIPIITFIIGLSINNNYLILLSIGIILTGLLNFILKLFFSLFSNPIFKRPFSNTPGFPSGHSQTIWFFTIFILLLSLKYKSIFFYPISIIVITLAILISLSRLGWFPLQPYKISGKVFHTFFQVLVGAIIGIVTAYYFFIYSEKLILFFKEKVVYLTE